MKETIAILNRETNGSKKWNREYISHRFKLKDDVTIYPLFIADMDYRHSDQLLEEIKAVVADDDFGYFDLQPAYYQSIQDWYRNIHDIDINKDWIIAANGTIAALHMAAHCLSKDDNYLMLTPVYGVFKALADGFGTRFEMPLGTDEENQYFIDFNLFESMIVENQIGTLLFCNPHNPSGKVWCYEDLKIIVAICKKYDVKIFSDEIHADFTWHKPFVSLVEFQDIYDKILVSTSPNKSFNTSGLTTSYLLCPFKPWKDRIEETLKLFHISVNRMGAEVSRIVYESGESWLNDIKEIIWNNITFVSDICYDVGLKVIVPESGYLVWISGEKLKDVDAYVQDLSYETGVLLETGSRFIGNYDSHLRINVATDSKMLQEAMILFTNHYKNYKGE